MTDSADPMWFAVLVLLLVGGGVLMALAARRGR